MLDYGPTCRSGEIVLSRLLRCIRAVPVLAAAAIAIAGCADSRMTAANPSSNANAQASNDVSQAEQPYKTGYGFSSDGPTTDLYTELFGSSRRDDRTAAPSAPAQPVEPVIASATIQPVQPSFRCNADRLRPRSAKSFDSLLEELVPCSLRTPATTPELAFDNGFRIIFIVLSMSRDCKRHRSI